MLTNEFSGHKNQTCAHKSQDSKPGEYQWGYTSRTFPGFSSLQSRIKASTQTSILRSESVHKTDTNTDTDLKDANSGNFFNRWN